MKMVFKEATAAVTAATYELKADKVVFITNDDSTNDLQMSFDGTNYFTVKAGESFTDFGNVRVHTISYKSSASTVAFRIWGLQD